MKHQLLLCGSVVIFLNVSAQSIGIGTNTPNASAALEIKSSNKGLLVPRTSTVTRTAIVAPAKGLMVYDTTTSSFWYHNGSAWVNIQAGNTGADWTLTGNTGTNPAINFLGTTDNQPLVFKINTSTAGYLGTNGNAFWGKGSGSSNTTGYSNTAIGTDALKVNSSRSNLVAVGDSALLNNGSGVSAAYQARENTAIGSKSLYSNTTGYGNTAVGFFTLFNNTTGYNNTAIGGRTMISSSEGHDNAAFGTGALGNNEGNYNTAIGVSTLAEGGAGNNNTAVGHYALFSNHFDANNNTGIGSETLYANTIGNTNTGVGDKTLYSNTTGHSNVAIGASALYYNTDQSGIVAIGDSALYNNGTSPLNSFDGEKNVAIGSKALYANSTGRANTATGFQALTANTTGGQNTAIGNQALFSNNSGINNNALGAYSLYKNIGGSHNVSCGSYSMQDNTAGKGNNAFGSFALFKNTVGNSNVAVGNYSLFLNTDRSNLVAIGDSALFNNGLDATLEFHASSNTAVGSKSLYSNRAGYSNSGLGKNAMYSNLSGYSNTAMGDAAMYSNSTGYANTAMGMFALYNNTNGFANTALGFQAGVASGSLVNSTAIGYNAIVNASNAIQIGNADVAHVYFGSPATTVLHAASVTPSDARFKYNIKNDVPGLSFIMQLKPVTYNFDTDKLNQFIATGTMGNEKVYSVSSSKSNTQLHSGFLAQDVEKAANAIGYDFDGLMKADKNPEKYYNLSYSQFVVPLVKAVQQLAEQNMALQSTIEEQNRKIEIQQQQMNAVLKEMQAIRDRLK